MHIYKDESQTYVLKGQQRDKHTQNIQITLSKFIHIVS